MIQFLFVCPNGIFRVPFRSSTNREINNSSESDSDTNDRLVNNFTSNNSTDAAQLKNLLIQIQNHLKTHTDQPNPQLFLKLASEFVNLSMQFEKNINHTVAEERRKRANLEQQIEALAEQHVNLESAAKNDSSNRRRAQSIKNQNSSTNINALTNPINIENVNSIQGETRARTTTGSSSKTMAQSEETVEDEFEDALSDGFEMNEDDVQLLDFQEAPEVGLEDEIHQKQGDKSDDSKNVLILSGAFLEPPYDNNKLIKPIQKLRRTTIAPRSSQNINLWNLIKNFVGQDLSRIPMPVNFNEPLSMLQRMAECIEYSQLLDTAATKQDSCEQMAYICANEISKFSCTRFRINKPFNPLLGETFEIDRYYEEQGFRLVIEQTSHHPPAASFFIESRKGWVSWGHSTLTSKFRGNYLSVMPVGLMHIYFPDSQNHYTCDTITTTAHNIIVGKLWMDNSGDQIIINHKTNDYCVLKYHPYSYFSRDPPRRVTGAIIDGKTQNARFVLNGDWDAKMSMKTVAKNSSRPKSTKNGPQYQTTGNPISLWKKTPVLDDAIKRYNFTDFSFTLNQLETDICSTDSRHRPDQRLMEQGHWDEANEVKKLLEEAQRKRRRELEAAAKEDLANGREPATYKATWFRKISQISEEEKIDNLYYKLSLTGSQNYKMVMSKLKLSDNSANDSSQSSSKDKNQNDTAGHHTVEPHIYMHQYWKCKAGVQEWPYFAKIFDVRSDNALTNAMIDKVDRKAREEIVESSKII